MYEVDPLVAALRMPAEEADEQDAAEKAAQRALALSTNRYKYGIVTYLEVVTDDGQHAPRQGSRGRLEFMKR